MQIFAYLVLAEHIVFQNENMGGTNSYGMTQ